MVEVGTATPPFRCRHTSSDAIISWRVTGSSIGRFPDIRSGSVNEDGNRVDTLTIPAEPQYNGTVVECIAFFLTSQAEVSPAATIFFTPTDSLPGTISIYNKYTTRYYSLHIKSFVKKKNDIHGRLYNIIIVTFGITPSPLTVAVEQGTATFQYQHPLADVIGWRVNGISLNMAVALPNVSTATPKLMMLQYCQSQLFLCIMGQQLNV